MIRYEWRMVGGAAAWYSWGVAGCQGGGKGEQSRVWMDESRLAMRPCDCRTLPFPSFSLLQTRHNLCRRYEKLMLRRIQWDAEEEEEQEGMEEAEAPKAPNYCRLVWQVRGMSAEALLLQCQSMDRHAWQGGRRCQHRTCTGSATVSGHHSHNRLPPNTLMLTVMLCPLMDPALSPPTGHRAEAVLSEVQG